MNCIKYAFLLYIVFALVACKGDTTNVDNSIHIRLKKEPERINPILFPNAVAREVYQYIHLPLADYDPTTLQLSPILISELPAKITIDTGFYKGRIAYDLAILPEAKWDDGSDITAEDYLFTLKAIRLPITNAGNYRELEQYVANVIIDATDNKKCRVVLSTDHLSSLEIATNFEVYPKYFYDPKGLLDTYSLQDFGDENMEKINADSTLVSFANEFNGNDFSRNKMSGSGPYQFVSWTADQNIILTKKEDYWAKDSKIPALMQGPNKMIFSIIPDEITAIAQLKSGNIDVINEISADNYLELNTDSIFGSTFQFFHPALIKQYLININNQNPKLKEVEVRRALAYLFDVDNIIANLESGMAVRTVGPIHPIKETHNNALNLIPFDIEKAKQILGNAGWADSNNNGVLDKKIDGKTVDLNIEILITGQALGRNIALMFKENAAKAGVNIEIVEKEFKLIRSENLKTRKYELLAGSLSQDINTFDDLDTKWHSNSDTPDGGNHCSYRDPKVDAMIDEIASSSTTADKMVLYKNIQAQIYNDQPAIFLYAPEEKIVISKKWNSTSTAKRPGYMANTFTLSNTFVPASNK